MRQGQILFLKEWMEFLRTYKFLMITCLFLFFGFSNPLVAKFMPEILANFLPKEAANAFPEPSAFDSWGQFFKNSSQLGLFIFILVFSSTLSKERQTGTLLLSLTKGLPRVTVIIVKFIFITIVWTISYSICFAITYFYTQYYWPNNDVQQLFLALFTLWVFGLLLIALIILGNVLFPNLIGTLLLIVGFIALLLLIAIFPKLENVQLLRLATENNAVLYGQFGWSDYYIPLLVTGTLTLAVLVSAISLFNKKAI